MQGVNLGGSQDALAGVGKRDLEGRESIQGISVSKLSLWATGLTPSGNCEVLVSELSQLSGEGAGVFILPSIPINHW